MVPFSSAGILIGGYEENESQPNPFVAIDFPDRKSAEEAHARVEEHWSSENVRIRIRSIPEGDLSVTVYTHEPPSTLCEGVVWKDEMWQIFMSYFQQVNRVLLMFSTGGVVQPQSSLTLPAGSLDIQVKG
ncbi:hypothetical protein [Paludifilum halophilum]|uniref:Uncharacterized protein n=1 Tax=Paludifilum halophilum TaxID=1642702 RepID=A0A235B9A0_9BACL|nr:hypothetical protein [Paludifilum halophilum]OYD08883.1 hypothetical protein CHM34_03620 [Paludifilum halophilum]